MRSCEACGGSLEGTHPSRRFCDDKCRKRGARGAKVTELHGADGTPPATVYGATLATLQTADRADTPAGAAALVIARKLDAGGDTGSAVAALTRELRAAVAEAVANATVAGDQIDEIARKREERLRRVGGA